MLAVLAVRARSARPFTVRSALGRVDPAIASHGESQHRKHRPQEESPLHLSLQASGAGQSNLNADAMGSPQAPETEASLMQYVRAPSRLGPESCQALARLRCSAQTLLVAKPKRSRHGRSGDEAAEQGDEADEAGASDGASQLIPGVRPTLPECAERTLPGCLAGVN
jgi:hypothetical protein